MARLGDLVEQIRGVSYKPEDLHDALNENSVMLLRSNNIRDGEVNFDDVVYVDKRKVKTPQYLRAGDIFVCASSGSKDLVGKAAFVPEDIPAVFGAFCKVVRPKTDCPRYIGHFFDSPAYRRRISARATGANINNIRNEHIDELIICIPAHEEQAEICATLDHVNKLISYRREQLAKLDELVKARFVEMFGDPVLNPCGWNVVSIGDIVTDVRYGTSRPATEGGKHPYLRMNNLTNDGHLDLTDLKYIDIPDNEIEKCIVRKGDVLFNRTNSIDLVGKTCVFDLEQDMVIAGYIIRVRVNEKILPAVLSCYMNSAPLKKQLRNMAKGAVNQANINAQELQSIKVYIPPINQQEQFVTFVEQTDKLKLAAQKSLEELELLKDALMQKYFG